jgi:hypothetical protein
MASRSHSRFEFLPSKTGVIKKGFDIATSGLRFRVLPGHNGSPAGEAGFPGIQGIDTRPHRLRLSVSASMVLRWPPERIGVDRQVRVARLSESPTRH